MCANREEVGFFLARAQSRSRWMRGISSENGMGVSTAVCRDHTGLYLGSSAIVFNGITDPKNLEMVAIKEGPSLTMDL